MQRNIHTIIKVFKQVSFITFFCIFLSACQEDKSVKAYKVLKETQQKSAYGYTWKKPIHWLLTQNSSGFKGVTFLVPQPEDTQNLTTFAKASFLILEGEAGGIISNVNRWRNQLGLAPQKAENILSSAHTLQNIFGTARIFKLVNKEQTKAIYAAMYVQQKETLFIKIIGSVETLQANSDAFISFVDSFRKERGAV